jgi:hypothetical protein
VARAVSDLAKRAVFTLDTGLNALWSANWIRQSGSQRIIGSFNNTAVGTALGQANTVTPRLASATEQPSPWPKSRGFLSEQMKSPA